MGIELGIWLGIVLRDRVGVGVVVGVKPRVRGEIPPPYPGAEKGLWCG